MIVGTMNNIIIDGKVAGVSVQVGGVVRNFSAGEWESFAKSRDPFVKRKRKSAKKRKVAKIARELFSNPVPK